MPSDPWYDRSGAPFESPWDGAAVEPGGAFVRSYYVELSSIAHTTQDTRLLVGSERAACFSIALLLCGAQTAPVPRLRFGLDLVLPVPPCWCCHQTDP